LFGNKAEILTSGLGGEAVIGVEALELCLLLSGNVIVQVRHGWLEIIGDTQETRL